MLERRMLLNKFALFILRALSPKYISIREDREPVHVVELRKSTYNMPISGQEYLKYEDVQITYITIDGKFFTLPDKIFYKYYGRKV